MNFSLFAKACNFAAIKHTNQRRKSGDIPYINHPLEVAYILADAGVEDVATLCAAVLHDTVEDTATSNEELAKEFGAEVASIVGECSDDKTLGKVERKRMQIKHAAHSSPKAKLVKMGDKISNLKTLVEEPIWPAARVLGYGIWSNEVFEVIKGGNAKLDQQLSQLLERMGVFSRSAAERAKLLEEYYADLQDKKD